VLNYNESLSWQKIESVIKEFANSLDSDLQTEKVHSIGGQIEYFKFTDRDELVYELKLSKPILEYGSRLRIESNSGKEKIDIESSANFFGKPKLQIKSGTISESGMEKILKIQKLIRTFSWNTGEKLIFITRNTNFDLETLELVRDVHLEFKNSDYNIT
jgi:hypothetical protein